MTKSRASVSFQLYVKSMSLIPTQSVVNVDFWVRTVSLYCDATIALTFSVGEINICGYNSRTCVLTSVTLKKNYLANQ